MSRYSGNNEQCPGCGIKYRDFRCETFRSFQEVKDSLWVDSDDSYDWRYRRKGTVLGVWHMAKQIEWAEHLKLCPYNKLDENNEEEYVSKHIGNY